MRTAGQGCQPGAPAPPHLPCCTWPTRRCRAPGPAGCASCRAPAHPTRVDHINVLCAWRGQHVPPSSQSVPGPSVQVYSGERRERRCPECAVFGSALDHSGGETGATSQTPGSHRLAACRTGLEPEERACQGGRDGSRPGAHWYSSQTLYPMLQAGVRTGTPA
jgi:hypothetical protein